MTSCVSFDTPFGWITLEDIAIGRLLLLKRIRFGKFCDVATGSEFSRKTKNDILDYLQGKSKEIIYELPLHLNNLTSIQIKMIKELQKTKYGETISYKELANRIGTSPRACGRILGSNPFPIIIPCHRVIRADGSLGGYSSGIELKRKLLKLEFAGREKNFGWG